MPKFTVIYVAVQHRLTHRQGKNGTTELLGDEIAFREEKAVIVEAPDASAAVKQVRLTVPADCDFNAQVHGMDRDRSHA